MLLTPPTVGNVKTASFAAVSLMVAPFRANELSVAKSREPDVF
jgi:hypothetical protein